MNWSFFFFGFSGQLIFGGILWGWKYPHFFHFLPVWWLCFCSISTILWSFFPSGFLPERLQVKNKKFIFTAIFLTGRTQRPLLDLWPAVQPSIVSGTDSVHLAGLKKGWNRLFWQQTRLSMTPEEPFTEISWGEVRRLGSAKKNIWAESSRNGMCRANGGRGEVSRNAEGKVLTGGSPAVGLRPCLALATLLREEKLRLIFFCQSQFFCLFLRKGGKLSRKQQPKL